MPLQLLEGLGFEVGVSENVEDLEDAGQGSAAVPLGVPGEVVSGLLEQVLQS